jgi:GTPase-associated system-like protein
VSGNKIHFETEGEMLSKVYEWSRIIHPAPDDDFVTKRTAVIIALVEAFSTNAERMIDCACIVAVGVTQRFVQETPIMSEVIAAIKKEQPATPEAISQNLMNIQSCCALVVGEIAERQRKKGGRSAKCDAMVAVVLTALANRRPPTEKHLREMVSELLEICRAVANVSATSRHQRHRLSSYVNQILEAGDVPTFWKEAKKQFTNLANAIEANEAVTREELDTLWWAFNGVSTGAGTPFADMPPGLVALDSAAELSGLVLVPPLPNTAFLLSRVLKVSRQAKDLEDQNLKDLLGQWDKLAAKRYLTGDEQASTLVQSNPAVFPLSWICLRLIEGASFLSDMKKATGWDPAGTIRPDRLSFQAFQEKVTLQLCRNAE